MVLDEADWRLAANVASAEMGDDWLEVDGCLKAIVVIKIGAACSFVQVSRPS